VYDKDNSDFNKELNILPDNEFHKNDLNMLQNFDEKPKITVLDLAKNNCFDNVHDVCGVNLVTSQVHTKFRGVACSGGDNFKVMAVKASRETVLLVPITKNRR
jgi:hypothetical protein